MTTITKERIELFIKNPLENGLTRGEQMELARIALASLQREQIRHEHAKWSDSTFGCVGPIGPLKHLSKEALEAAAEPDDLSEWADMQFLLWDAQRRAGISDAEITAAMEDKLKINMERQWPEPKDGEPRLHIKEPGNSPVIPDGWVMVPKELTPEMMRAVQIRSELGGYATSNLSGAYNMFSEFWNVAVSAAPKVDDL
ncbi:eaa protein [Escherichia coli E1520]|nr:eaa protein [Escherichia coli E1520]